MTYAMNEVANMEEQGMHKTAKRQKGFTLIELMVVIVILGVLAYVAMNAFGGGTNSANATAIRSAGNELARAVGFLNVNLGTGTDTSGSNPLTATGEDMMGVLVKGGVAVASAYRPRFDLLNMRPLQGKINATGTGASTTYSIMGYPIRFVQTGCPTNKVCVQVDNVPAAVVTEMAIKENLTYTTTAFTTGENLRWTAAAGGQHNITMLFFP